MKHLTVDEMIDFVSLTELTSESVALSASVNGHIRGCKRCLKLVRSFQMVYDEISKIGTKDDFKHYITEIILEQKKKLDKNAEMQMTFDEVDGLD